MWPKREAGFGSAETSGAGPPPPEGGGVGCKRLPLNGQNHQLPAVRPAAEVIPLRPLGIPNRRLASNPGKSAAIPTQTRLTSEQRVNQRRHANHAVDPEPPPVGKCVCVGGLLMCVCLTGVKDRWGSTFREFPNFPKIFRFFFWWGGWGGGLGLERELEGI